jgi:hypothetical protein
MNKIILIISITFITSCATKLKVIGEPGIAIPKPQLVKLIETTNYEAIPGAVNPQLCNQSSVSESLDYITSSEYYYVNFKPSQFSKGTFEVNFNANGLASKISINSEANTGLDSINSLVGTLIPYYKTIKQAAAPAVITPARRAAGPIAVIPASKLKDASCIIKSKTIKIEPISTN